MIEHLLPVTFLETLVHKVRNSIRPVLFISIPFSPLHIETFYVLAIYEVT